MNAAIVDLVTGIVINVVVVDSADDPAPDGTAVVAIPDDLTVGPNQATWTQAGGFITPEPETAASAPPIDGNMTTGS